MKLWFALAALAALLAPPVHASDDITVTLHVGAANHALPDVATCSVSIPAGSTTTAAVLDAAVASGCISSWTADDYGTPGHPDRFVSSIDGIAQQTGTFWAFYVDEQLASTGIDGHAPVAGDDLEFTYVDWFTPFPPFSDVLP